MSFCEKQIQSKVSIQNPTTNKFMQVLPGKRVNFCKLFKNPRYDPFLYKFINTFAKFATVEEKCPFFLVSEVFRKFHRFKLNSFSLKGKHEIRGFKFDTSVLPAFTPVGPYLAELVFSEFINGTYINYLTFDMLLEIVYI